MFFIFLERASRPYRVKKIFTNLHEATIESTWFKLGQPPSNQKVCLPMSFQVRLLGTLGRILANAPAPEQRREPFSIEHQPTSSLLGKRLPSLRCVFNAWQADVIFSLNLHLDTKSNIRSVQSG